MAQLAEIALDLWEERGYSAVSMGEIAATAGVTTRTLHRYFSSKSDIIWGELARAFDDLELSLKATPGDLPLLVRIRSAIGTVLSTDGDAPEHRRRLRIVARTPELQAATSPPFLAWRATVRDFARAHLTGPSAQLDAEIIASAVQSVTMVAITWWALHGDASPENHVDHALRLLESGFREAPPDAVPLAARESTPQ
jgi:AcrR family transcriptional regulator